MTALRFLRFAFVLSLFVLAIPATTHAACTNPAGDEKKIIFNTTSKQFQYCDGINWIAMHPPPPSAPTGCPVIGNVCSDGSVYAGLSPDGSVPMYTTPADAGQFSWNDGTVNPVDTPMENCNIPEVSCQTGEANTALLAGLGTTPSPAPYVAARHCASLTSHGQADWYLPAQYELQVMLDNQVAIGGFDVTVSSFYWSSSERLDVNARSLRFSDNFQTSLPKQQFRFVRCVRKVGGATACTNPAGVEGQMIYNPDNRVLQGCAAGAWRALGPINGTALPTDFCDTIGEVCRDGSVYAGLSPDGNEPMYTTPADAGQFTWNDGTSNWGDTGMQDCVSDTPGAQASCQTGEANTALLVGLGTTPSPAPYVAARHCNDLSVHGQSDWYLPAQDELAVLYDNRAAIGGFDLGGGAYWSSSEEAVNDASSQHFNLGNQANNTKDTSLSIRCARKQPTHVLAKLQCSNPVRDEGAVMFSNTLKVMQYCDGVNWVSIGKEPPDPCAGSPAPGQVCADGSVYAGLSPDGGVKMYTTPTDAGGFPWNNGNINYTFANQPSYTTGETNTGNLIAIDSDSGAGGTQPHQAAQYCADLSAHSQTDWYLPAVDELDVLYDYRVAIGGFDVSGSFPAGQYWSSTEGSNTVARRLRFSDGNESTSGKGSGLSVRCVRK